jgi:hypothetical protein
MLAGGDIGIVCIRLRRGRVPGSLSPFAVPRPGIDIAEIATELLVTLVDRIT